MNRGNINCNKFNLQQQAEVLRIWRDISGRCVRKMFHEKGADVENRGFNEAIWFQFVYVYE